MRRFLSLLLVAVLVPVAVGACAAHIDDGNYCRRGEAAVAWSDGDRVNRLQVLSQRGAVGDVVVPLSDISVAARLHDGRFLIGAAKDERRARLAVFDPQTCTIKHVGTSATVAKGLLVEGGRVWTYGPRDGVDVVQALDEKFMVRRSRTLLGMTIRSMVPLSAGVLVIGDHAAAKAPRAILLDADSLAIKSEYPLPESMSDATSAVAAHNQVFIGLDGRGQGGAIGVLTAAGEKSTLLPLKAGADPTHVVAHKDRLFVFHRPRLPDPNEHESFRGITVVNAGTKAVVNTVQAPFSIDAESFLGEKLWTVQADREGIRLATYEPGSLSPLVSTAVKVASLRPGECIRALLPLR